MPSLISIYRACNALPSFEFASLGFANLTRNASSLFATIFSKIASYSLETMCRLVMWFHSFLIMSAAFSKKLIGAIGALYLWCAHSANWFAKTSAAFCFALATPAYLPFICTRGECASNKVPSTLSETKPPSNLPLA